MFHALKNVGEILQSIGIALILIMAVIGTFAIDLVILAFLLKQPDEFRDEHPFYTFMVWQMIFSNHNRPTENDFLIKLILAPITTIIAIALSFALGVPMVGIYLAAGWGVALGTLGLGAWISQLANMGIEYFDSSNTPPPGFDTINTYVYTPPSAPPMVDAVFVNELREPYKADATPSSRGFFSASIPVDIPVAYPVPSAPSFPY